MHNVGVPVSLKEREGNQGEKFLNNSCTLSQYPML